MQSPNVYIIISERTIDQLTNLLGEALSATAPDAGAKPLNEIFKLRIIYRRTKRGDLATTSKTILFSTMKITEDFVTSFIEKAKEDKSCNELDNISIEDYNFNHRIFKTQETTGTKSLHFRGFPRVFTKQKISTMISSELDFLVDKDMYQLDIPYLNRANTEMVKGCGTITFDDKVSDRLVRTAMIYLNHTPILTNEEGIRYMFVDFHREKYADIRDQDFQRPANRKRMVYRGRYQRPVMNIQQQAQPIPKKYNYAQWMPDVIE